MSKDKTKRIANLKTEITLLEEKIREYEKTKPAFAKRLRMILKMKNNQLWSWIRNQ